MNMAWKARIVMRMGEPPIGVFVHRFGFVKRGPAGAFVYHRWAGPDWRVWP